MIRQVRRLLDRLPWIGAEARLKEKYLEAFSTFFDGYSRGGEKQRDELVVDYDFFLRSEVKKEMEKLSKAYPVDVETLLREYRKNAGSSQVMFLRNLVFLNECYLWRLALSLPVKERIPLAVFMNLAQIFEFRLRLLEDMERRR